jgi:hypothetical protein
MPAGGAAGGARLSSFALDAIVGSAFARPDNGYGYGSGKTEAMEPVPDHGEKSYRGSGRLADKKAIITGADSGIGRAVAIAYAREGADVLISYPPVRSNVGAPRSNLAARSPVRPAGHSVGHCSTSRVRNHRELQRPLK